MDEPSQRKPIRHPDAAFRVFGEEAVVINTAENVVRLLNDSASRIWQLADGTRTQQEIAAALTTEFDVDGLHALQSVSEFVDEMVDKGLLVLRAAESDTRSVAPV